MTKLGKKRTTKKTPLKSPVGRPLKIKRDSLDTLFSRYMRLKAQGRCERCGRNVGFKKLQVSHLFGRRYKSVRWSERNVSVLCFTCHMGAGGFHESPVEHVQWFIQERGQQEYDLLQAEVRVSAKHLDRKLLEIYFRSEIEKLEAMNGEFL